MTTIDKIMDMFREEDRVLAEMNQNIEQIENNLINFLDQTRNFKG